MRKQTKKTAFRLKIMSFVLLIFFLLLGIGILFVTLKQFGYSKDMILHQSEKLALELMISSLYKPLFLSAACVINGFLSFALLNGFATVIENLDKTALIDAIDRNSLSNLDNSNGELRNYLLRFTDAYKNK